MTMDFDKRAKDWDDPKKIETAEAVARSIMKNVPLSKEVTRALEYGCGTGLVSFCLQPFLKEITLADDSQGMLEELKKKIEATGATNMRPVMLDLVKDAPFEDGEEVFDLIYISMTLHHIKDVARILNIFHSLLTPGGWLCVADLDKEGGEFHAGKKGFDGHHGFDRVELSSLLSESGFSGIDFETCHMIEKNTKDGIKEFPVFVACCKKPGVKE